MKHFPLSEQTMWDDLEEEAPSQATDEEINKKYGMRELRIVTETNREQLPNFVAALKRPDWLRLQPFYQRRKRWDDKRKSKLIESFIMNIPVPPCFLFESDFARYEVMDGQQRISAIWDFYNNKFKLKGLEQWPELNGRIYDRLPSEIRRGLDRRSISYIVLLKESAIGKDEMLLRQQVFERLNTGGVELENQEIRHCIYHNEFDKALVDLSKHPALRRAWELPLYSQEEESNPPDVLLNKPHFSKMRDVEFVLRFFALRHVENYRGGMHAFLDQYMVRSDKFSEADIDVMKKIFVETMELAELLYGEHLFKPWIPMKESWAAQPQIAFADAVAGGLSGFLEQKAELIARREAVVERTKEMIASQPAGAFTGQRNTKKDVKDRLESYEAMLAQVLS